MSGNESLIPENKLLDEEKFKYSILDVNAIYWILYVLNFYFFCVRGFTMGFSTLCIFTQPLNNYILRKVNEWFIPE